MKRNRCILLLFIVIATIFVSKFGGAISYLFFYGVLLVPLLSGCYLLYVFLRFRIYQYIDTKTMVKEECVPYYFQLANEDYITYTNVRVTFVKDMATVANMNPEDTYCLLPKESIQRETTICCHYRGEYKVGIDYVIVRDFFHLFQIKYACDSKIQVTVKPRVVPLKHLGVAPAQLDEKRSKTKVERNPMLLENELRRYEPGDSMKRIHWKATAKAGQLMSRKMEDEPKTEIVCFMDTRKTQQEELQELIIEDRIIECILAISNYFCNHNIPVKVVYQVNQIQVVEIQNRTQFEEFYKECCALFFLSGFDMGQLLANYTKTCNQIGYYMMITAQLSDAFCIACYEALSYGADVTVIYIGTEGKEENMHRLDERVHFFQITPESKIEDVLENG